VNVSPFTLWFILKILQTKMKTSNKLKNWMKHFYHYSSDKDNKFSKLQDEFKELREIIKEIKMLERK